MTQEFNIETVLIRGNSEMLTSCTTGKLLEVQCGAGWWKIIGDCLDAIAHEMIWYPNHKVTFSCIKEKFAGLKMYYCIKHRDFIGEQIESSPDLPMGLDDRIQQLITLATLRARTSCELCGHEGHIRGGMPLQTLCDFHAHQLSRPQLDPVMRMYLQGTKTELMDHMKKTAPGLKLPLQEENDKLCIRGDGGPTDWTEGAKEGPCAGEIRARV